MYKIPKFNRTTINLNQSMEGETIEQKIERIVNNGEPISESAPIVYQERADGVHPAYDIRTDRFEIAVDAMEKVSKSEVAKREGKVVDFNSEKAKKEGSENPKNDGGAEPTQGGGKSTE